MALENIANSDAFYHNVEHTILVTLVGQEILLIANLNSNVFRVEHSQVPESAVAVVR